MQAVIHFDLAFDDENKSKIKMGPGFRRDDEVA